MDVQQAEFPPAPLVSRLVIEGVVAELRWHEEVSSTNAVLLDAIAGTAPHGLVVGAERQTAGRGRRGRSWHAPAGTSLTFSTLWRPSLPTVTWTLLPLVAGLALHDVAAEACPAAQVQLKWPNDLLVEGRKAAGILLEAREAAVVVGIGLNVDWRGVVRPEGLVATSLAEHAPTVPDRGEVLEALLRRLVHWYETWASDPGRIVPSYVPRCGTLGNRVVAVGVEGGTGTAVALTPQGHLRIRPDVGPDMIVTAGEVEHLR